MMCTLHVGAFLDLQILLDLRIFWIFGSFGSWDLLDLIQRVQSLREAPVLDYVVVYWRNVRAR